MAKREAKAKGERKRGRKRHVWTIEELRLSVVRLAPEDSHVHYSHDQGDDAPTLPTRRRKKRRQMALYRRTLCNQMVEGTSTSMTGQELPADTSVCMTCHHVACQLASAKKRPRKKKEDAAPPADAAAPLPVPAEGVVPEDALPPPTIPDAPPMGGDEVPS